MTLGTLNIPHIEIEEFNTGEKSYQFKLFSQFMDIVQNTPYGQKIKRQLSIEPRVQSLNGATITQVQSLNGATITRVPSSGSFDIDVLACWFIWRINLVGYQQAEAELNTYLNSTEIDTVHALWILGIELENTVELSNGIKIIPINEMPNSDFKEKFLQNRLRRDLFRLPSPRCAIVINSTQNKLGKIQKDHSVYEKINAIALLLNLISNASCLPYLNTVGVAEHTPIGLFGGTGGSSSIGDVIGNKTQQLTQSDFDEINDIFKSFLGLSEKEQSRFRTIIKRISQAKRRSSIEDKILDLVISLEMMLLENNDKSQLKLQFRLRGSLLISTTDIEKTNSFATLGKLYDYRSSVAHSGMLKEQDKASITKGFPEFFNLTETICKTLILNGKPDWNKLVLGIKT